MKAAAPLDDEVVTTIEGIDEPAIVEEPMCALEGATVVFADDALLRGDFPWLVAPEATPAEQRRTIDAWLLRHAALVSRPQAAQCTANTPVATGDRSVPGYRPPRYGRAAIVEVSSPDPARPGHGLLDIKGIGVRDHEQVVAAAHANGLCRLDHTLCEVAYQRLIDAVFEHAGVGVTTVPVYAIIDPGFEIIDSGGPRAAAIIVRRAHQRHRHGVELPLHGSVEHVAYTAVELLLRRYGISSTSPSAMVGLTRDASGTGRVTTGGEVVDGLDPALFERLWTLAGAGRWTVCDGINIQTTRTLSWRPLRATLVDFGHYMVHESFAAPLLSLVRDRPVAWGGLIRPDHPDFVQPHPVNRAGADLWGRHPIDPHVAALTGTPPGTIVKRPMELAMRLAHGWRTGELAGADIDGALDDHVAATTARWRPAGSSVRVAL